MGQGLARAGDAAKMAAIRQAIDEYRVRRNAATFLNAALSVGPSPRIANPVRIPHLHAIRAQAQAVVSRMSHPRNTYHPLEDLLHRHSAPRHYTLPIYLLPLPSTAISGWHISCGTPPLALLNHRRLHFGIPISMMR